MVTAAAARGWVVGGWLASTIAEPPSAAAALTGTEVAVEGEGCASTTETESVCAGAVVCAGLGLLAAGIASMGEVG